VRIRYGPAAVIGDDSRSLVVGVILKLIIRSKPLLGTRLRILTATAWFEGYSNEKGSY
jgi:hypothetical protein